MYSNGHVGIAFIMYSPIASVLMFADQFTQWSLLLFAVIGAMVVGGVCPLPDKDIIWQRTLPIKHRGITHTFPFAIFTGLLGLLIGAGIFLVMIPELGILDGNVYTQTWAISMSLFIGFTAMYGVCTHYIGDIITPAGLKPLWPVKDKKYCYEMEILGQRSKAANPYWNWSFFVIGHVLLTSTLLLNPTIRTIVFGG